MREILLDPSYHLHAQHGLKWNMAQKGKEQRQYGDS